MLIIPFPESSLNQEAGKLFMENYNEYVKIASLYTNIHATHKFTIKNSDEENENRCYSRSMSIKNNNIIYQDSLKNVLGNSDENIELKRRDTAPELQSKLNISDLSLIRSFSNNSNENWSYTTPKSKKDELKKWMSRL